MNASMHMAPTKRASSEYQQEVGPKPSRQGTSAGAPYVFRRKPVPQHRVTLEEAIPELSELRQLLEEHLSALRAIYLEHRQVIGLHMQEPNAPLDELRALASPNAPWVTALDQTRQIIRSSFLDIAAACIRAHSARA